MENKDPVKRFEERLLSEGVVDDAGRRGDPGADREGVRGGLRVRAGLAVPRAGGPHQGLVGRGRVLDERARTRRRDRGHVMSAAQNTKAEKTQQVEAGAAGHGAEPRGKRTEDGQATYLVAIAEALWEEMERDERVYMLGEDIGVYGGAFKVTEGFYDRFGARPRDGHADRRGDDRRDGDRLGDGGVPAGRRVPVLRLHDERVRRDLDGARPGPLPERGSPPGGAPRPVRRHGPRLVLPLDQPGAVVRLLGRHQDRLPRVPRPTRRA